MARYWVGGTGNYNDTAHWSDTSGGASGFSVPTTSDDVIFDSSSSVANAAYTVTINVSSQARDFTMGGPGAGNNVTWAGSSALEIRGSMNLSAGSADLTRTYTGTITFSATTTGQTITLNGVTLSSSIVFNGSGGEWTLQDSFNIGALITLTQGTLLTNGVTVTASNFTTSGSLTRVLTLGSSSFNLTTGNWSAGGSNVTINAGTSTITLSGSSSDFTGGGFTYNNVTFTGVTNIAGGIINDSNSFNNLSLSSQGAFIFNADQTITGTLTATGASASARLLIRSNTIGTARTLTANAVSLTNVDFTDITAAGAASPFTGTSIGNAQGNSNITFTAPVTRYAVTGTSKGWNDITLWSASSGGATAVSVPICHDTVIFDANSITAGGVTITLNTVRIGADISFTGVTNNPTLAFTSNNNFIQGSLTLASGMTISGTNTTTFTGRGTHTLTSAAVSFTQAITFDGIGGSYTLQDSYTLLNLATTTVSSGTFNANNFNVTTGRFSSSNSTTRTITMGSGTWTLDGTGTIWDIGTTTGLTFNANTSTIKITNTGATGRTFAGGGLTYNNLWSSAVASTASLTISGSNTFNDFKDDGTAAHSILFTTGTTQTVTTFTVSGTVGNLITINSTSTGTHFLVKAGGGQIIRDYLDIQHSVATPSCTWFAGDNSVNDQGVPTAGSGWTFNSTGICASLVKQFGLLGVG